MKKNNRQGLHYRANSLEKEKAFVAELREMHRQGIKIRLELNPAAAFAVLANLQLAARHPGNNGPSVKIARGVADRIADHFDGPISREVIRQGWDPSFDVKVES